MPRTRKLTARKVLPTQRELDIERLVKKYQALPQEERDAFLLDKQGLELVSMMARENFTDVKIAFLLQKTDLKQFRDQNPEFDLYYRYGQDQKLADVENAAFKAAIGFTASEEYETVWVDKEGVEHKNTCHKDRTFPPDPRAQQYILNNLRAQTYKDRQENTVTGSFSGLKVVLQFDDGNSPQG